MGKGDSYRPVDRAKFAANYDRIFGTKGKPAAQVEPKPAQNKDKDKDKS